MVFRKFVQTPYEWHTHFAWLPVIVYIDKQRDQNDKSNDRSMWEVTVWLSTVERKFEKNLTGTRQWVYRLFNDNSKNNSQDNRGSAE